MTLFQPTWKKDGQTVKGRVWWMEVRVGGKRHRRSLGVRDKRAAQIKAAEILRKLELRDAGLAVNDDAAKTEPTRLIREYEGELVRRRSSPAHVAHTIKRITDLVGKAHNLGEVTPARIRQALTKLTRRGLTGKTVNAYRVALSGFFAWLVREGRWETNPVAHVSRVRESEPERPRRAFAPEELAALLEAAPEPRTTCYRLAATTGLRRAELGRIRWADIDLDAATLRVRPSAAKNRKEAIQPLPPGTVAALAGLDGRGTPLAPVFPVVPVHEGPARGPEGRGGALRDG